MYDSDTGPISAVMNYRLVAELLVGREGNLGLRRIRFGLIRLMLVCLPISIQFHPVLPYFTWFNLASPSFIWHHSLLGQPKEADIKPY
jgi:hypothetical protein